VHERAEKALQNIDKACAHGCKKNSHGNAQFWTGYKRTKGPMHLDVSDRGFPLSAFVSGANVHDSPGSDTFGKDDGEQGIFLLQFDGRGL
jgi:hypothetical protein